MASKRSLEHRVCALTNSSVLGGSEWQNLTVLSSPLSLQSGSVSPTPLVLSHPGSVQGLPWSPHCRNEATEVQRGRCLTQGYKARQVAGWGPSPAFLPPSPPSPGLPAQGFIRHMGWSQGKPPSSEIIGLNGRNLPGRLPFEAW